MAIDQVYIRLDGIELDQLVEYLEELRNIKLYGSSYMLIADPNGLIDFDLNRLTENIKSQARSQAKITHCELRG